MAAVIILLAVIVGVVILFLKHRKTKTTAATTVSEAIDSRAFSDFCGVESSNQVPDGDTLGRFRNIIIHNGLQEQLFAQVVKLLEQKGLLLKKGTIVDSTIIAAPSSTKNQEKQRDPDAHQVKKGNEWHFGYKAHIGVDKNSGLVHIQAESPSFADEKGLTQITGTTQTQRTRKIICPSKCGACLWRRQRTFSIPKDTISRAWKTGRQIEYVVCTGKSDFG